MEHRTGAGLDDEAIRRSLKEYYGRVLKKTEDLEKKACCASATTSRFSDVLQAIPDEVKARNFGCGTPIPEDELAGLSVLDLGSGAGLDCFILSKLVGESGRVQGVDMTDEQLAIARRNREKVARAFGFAHSNVEFHQDFIETAAAVESGTVDLVVSNCTINLSPFKDKVFETAFRVLRAGGEVYFSDIVADRHVPQELKDDPRLVAECLGGALYEHELFDVMKDSGFGDPRVVTRALVEKDVASHPIRFYSVTVRAAKLGAPLDRRCEDYGQTAVYRGNCAMQPARFTYDDHHVFEAGRPAAVCRNTARLLGETRLKRYFDVTPPIRHFGIFPCGPAPVSRDEAVKASCC
jgi:SAM-dependent methyltransferase